MTKAKTIHAKSLWAVGDAPACNSRNTTAEITNDPTAVTCKASACTDWAQGRIRRFAEALHAADVMKASIGVGTMITAAELSKDGPHVQLTAPAGQTMLLSVADAKTLRGTLKIVIEAQAGRDKVATETILAADDEAVIKVLTQVVRSQDREEQRGGLTIRRRLEVA